MEADELRRVAPDGGDEADRDDPAGFDPRFAGAAARRARFAWLRRYVHARVEDRLAPGALERALQELRARPGDPD